MSAHRHLRRHASRRRQRGFIINPFVLGSAAFTGPLDAYASNLWFAGGIKRLRSSYTGPLIRVRKTSGVDTSTELDIGYQAGGGIDIGALATFAGSESVAVVKLYDQSGAANDFGQSAGTKQPRIVNAGVYDGFIRFDGTDDGFQSVNDSGTPAAFSVAWKVNSRTNTVTKVFYEHSENAGAVGNNSVLCYIGDPGPGARMIELVTQGTTGDYANYWTQFPNGNVHMGVYDRTVGTQAGDSTLYIAGALTARISGSTGGSGVGTGTTFTAERWNVGSRNNAGSLPSAIDLFAMAIYEANKSSDAAGIATALA